MTLTVVFLLGYMTSLTADMMLPINLVWVTLALVVVTLVGAFGWASYLDEAKLNAHYVAWFWGGSVGLSASMLAFVALLPGMLIPGAAEAMLPANLAPIAANLTFGAGFMLGIVPATMGYLVWWLLLSARRD
ncbi:MAG: hypothetical protein JNM59_10465 [Hyphomonadaceae bacterium]|nr:hypothetical protein [Hyphomonadaceae bacterium]